MCEWIFSVSVALSILYLIGLLKNSYTVVSIRRLLLLFCYGCYVCLYVFFLLVASSTARALHLVLLLLFQPSLELLLLFLIYSSVYCIHGAMPINVYTLLARKNSIKLLLMLILLLLLLLYICGYLFRTNDWLFSANSFFSLASKYWYIYTFYIALTTFQFWPKIWIHFHCIYCKQNHHGEIQYNVIRWLTGKPFKKLRCIKWNAN